MAARLRVIEGPDLGRTFILPLDTTFVIGRGRDSATQLQDLHVSRRHCLLQFSGGQWAIADLNSIGGTLLNGQPVTEGMLRPGDVIRIGDTQLRLVESNIADQATLPPTPGMHLPSAMPVGASGMIQGSSAVPPAHLFPVAQPIDPPPQAPHPVQQSTEDIPFVQPVEELEEVEEVAPVEVPLPRLSGDRMGELVGKTLAHFRIDNVIARGRSGVVFRAVDIDTAQDVALKVLRPEFTSDANEVQRFIRSMRTALPLRHPNLVQVLGAGRKGPYCWMSMEYVDGESLTQVIARIGVAGMLDWRHSFRVACQVGQALQYAHSRQIIHRNITPQNILIGKGERVVKLGDLMLAKALEGGLARHLTRPGETVGDVRYMAPEQVHSPTNIDARADLYSLGALLYALLTGRPPIDGGSLLDILAQVGRSPVKPKQFQMSIPDAFEGVVMRLISIRPEDRFQSATELLEVLPRVGRYHGLTV
jgi:serine/threonine-protein kinase